MQLLSRIIRKWNADNADVTDQGGFDLAHRNYFFNSAIFISW